jgi:hypothetical protein
LQSWMPPSKETVAPFTSPRTHDAESTVLDDAENQSFFGFQLGTPVKSHGGVPFEQLRKRPEAALS